MSGDRLPSATVVSYNCIRWLGGWKLESVAVSNLTRGCDSWGVARFDAGEKTGCTWATGEKSVRGPRESARWQGVEVGDKSGGTSARGQVVCISEDESNVTGLDDEAVKCDHMSRLWASITSFAAVKRSIPAIIGISASVSVAI